MGFYTVVVSQRHVYDASLQRCHWFQHRTPLLMFGSISHPQSQLLKSVLASFAVKFQPQRTRGYVLTG
jgi:hypothetical protein